MLRNTGKVARLEVDYRYQLVVKWLYEYDVP